MEVPAFGEFKYKLGILSAIWLLSENYNSLPSNLLITTTPLASPSPYGRLIPEDFCNAGACGGYDDARSQTFLRGGGGFIFPPGPQSGPKLSQIGGLGERCKVLQWDPERRLGRKRSLVYFISESCI